MRFLSLFGKNWFVKAFGDSSFRYAPFRMTGVCGDGEQSGGVAAALLLDCFVLRNDVSATSLRAERSNPVLKEQLSFRPKGGICFNNKLKN